MNRSLEQSIYFIIAASLLVLILEAISFKTPQGNNEKPHIKWLTLGAIFYPLIWIALDLYGRVSDIKDSILLVNHLSAGAIMVNSLIAIFIGQKTIRRSFHQGETYFLLLSSVALSISLIVVNNVLGKIICLIALHVVLITIFIKTIDEDYNIEIGMKLAINSSLLLITGFIAILVLLFSFGLLDLGEIAKKIHLASSMGFFGLLLLSLVFFIVAGLMPFHYGFIEALEGGNLAVCFFYLSNASVLSGHGLFSIQKILSHNKVFLSQFNSLMMFSLIVTLIIFWLRAMDQSKWRCTIAYISLTLSPMFSLSLLFAESQTLPKVWFLGVLFLFLVLCAFIIFSSLSYLAPLDSPKETWEDVAGLGRENKWQSFCLMAALVSIVGLPGTLGYFIKLALISEPEKFLLFNIAIFISIALGSALIMRIFVFLYSKQSLYKKSQRENPRPSSWLLLATSLLIILGFLPVIK